MKKNLVILAALVALTLALTACTGSQPTTAPTEPSTPAATEGTQGTQAELEAMFEGPVLVVSAGQSADVSIAKSLMSKVGVDFTVLEEGVATTGYKTALIVPGVSVKGLGQAGIEVDAELASTKQILADLQKEGTKILVAHLGGSSRRDELTDQFIDVVLPAADFIVALEEGNKDGKFSAFASSANIPCSIDKDIVSMVSTVKTVFGK